MQLGKPSKLPPREPCWVILYGRRRIRDAIYESLCEPLEVVEYVSGRDRELAVKMTGRRERFPLDNFSGEWTPIIFDALEAQPS